MNKLTNNRIAKKNDRRTRRTAALTTATMKLEGLESRQLMSVVNVSSYGAVANDGRDDTGAIKAAISAARAGDTVRFGAGVYNLSSQITFDSGETYTGDAGATLKFSNLAARQYGVHIAANASNVTINGLKFQGTGIRMSDGYYQNITITNNEITGTMAYTAGIYSYSGANNVKIEGNYFHDFSYWGALLAGVNKTSYSNNVFRNVVQVAHILNPGSDVSASFNVATGLQRMGLEIQQSYGLEKPNGTFNLTVEGNVFYDWKNPYWDSFGLSIMPQTAKNTRVVNNYMRATRTENWKEADSGGHYRWGYGIEYGTNTGQMSGNVVIGPWANHVVVSTQGNVVQNNKLYGQASWSAFITGEPGIGNKWGSPVSINNVMDKNMANAPAVPAWAVARMASPLGTPVLPNPTPAPEPEPESKVPTPTNVKASASTAGQIDLSWSASTAVDKIQVQRKSRDGSDAWVTISTVNASTTTFGDKGFTDEQKKNTWAFAYRVVAVDGADSSAASAMDSAQLVTAPTPAPTPNPTPTPTPDPTPDGDDDEVIPPTNTGPTFVSDLASTSSKNAWGNYEKDRSNGEKGTNDGRKISLRGKAYDKGLGIHAGSEIVYKIDGKWATFVSDVGVDDEIGFGAGSIVFQVWGDGKLLASSGTMTSGMSPETLKVDVTGVKVLKLVATDAGDGTKYDHGDWANARLYVAGAYPPPIKNPSMLSDLNWRELAAGWGSAEKNQSNGEQFADDGRTLSINGKTYVSGIGAHAGSKLEFALDAQWKTFTTDIGIDDEVGLGGSVTFQVHVDGKLAYESGVLSGKDDAKAVTVNVQGAKQMWLVVTDGGNGAAFDHADWAGAKLVA